MLVYYITMFSLSFSMTTMKGHIVNIPAIVSVTCVNLLGNCMEFTPLPVVAHPTAQACADEFNYAAMNLIRVYHQLSDTAASVGLNGVRSLRFV